MGVTQDWLAWKPAALGDVTLTLTVPPHPDETLTDNNRMSVPVSVRQEKLRVLVVESYPRWEYRYLRNALSRDPGIELSCLLFHPGLSKPGGGNKDYIRQFPAGLDELSRFDVVFLGDVGVGGGQLTDEQCGWLKGLVEHQASGIVFMPGSHGLELSLQKTELDALFPVELDDAQAGRLGIEHALPFHPHGPRPAQPPDQAGRQRGREHGSLGRTARLPVVCLGGAGPARRRSAGGTQRQREQVRSHAAVGDPHLRRRKGPFHGDGRRVALAARGRRQVPLSLLGPGRALDGLSAQHGQRRNDAALLRTDQPQIDGTLTLNANVMNRGGEPLQGGDVTARITAPSGKAESIGFVSSGDAWGAYSAQFTAREPGRHQVVLTCKQTGAALEASFFVQGDAERAGWPAGAAGGDGGDSAGDAGQSDASGPPRGNRLFAGQPARSGAVGAPRLQVWSHPLAAGLVIALMGVFWVGRKAIGLI